MYRYKIKCVFQGRLNEADQILTVNGHNLEIATRDEAIRVLREAVAKDHVKMIVTRDEKARYTSACVF